MANSFTLTSNIDLKKIGRAMAEDEILIGWPQGIPHAESGEDIAEIARKLTFGAGPQTWEKTLGGETKTFHVSHVPARPIVDDGIEAGKPEIEDRIGKYYQAKLDGKDAKSLLHSIAVTAIGAIQRFARSGTYKSEKPNSPEWADFKKGAPPWIDTGQVINSLTYVIDDKLHEKVGSDSGKEEWVVK